MAGVEPVNVPSSSSPSEAGIKLGPIHLLSEECLAEGVMQGHVLRGKVSTGGTTPRSILAALRTMHQGHIMRGKKCTPGVPRHAAS